MRRGRAVARGARRDLAPARGRASRRRSTPTRDARSSTTTRELRLRRHDYVAEVVGGWAHARAHVRRPRRGRRARVPDPALGAPDRAGQPAAAVPDPGLSANSRRSRSNERREARPLAHPGLALQREGALGARPQGDRARAQGAAARARTWRSRCGSTRGAHEDLPGAAARRPQRSATRPRSSRRSSSAGPSRPLYPEDPAERRRALELEDYFDEQLGPQIRLLAWHELRNDPRADGAARAPRCCRRRCASSPVARRALGALRLGLRRSCATGSQTTRPRRGAARDGRRGARPARGRARRDGGDYLVGDRFTVADLTAAALFYPLSTRPRGRSPAPSGRRRCEQFAEPLARAPGVAGSSEMFAATASRSRSR